jgi:N-carbamoyl-L-amino-acid hydrolase
VLDVHPRAVNSIPRDVALEIDVRDVDGERRNRVVAAIRERADELARERGTPTTVELINADVPATCEETIIAVIEDAADAAELACRRMVSRAYHDSLFMARVAPISMIFIPCRDGVSHRPDEYADPEAIRAGVEVLARTLATLAER